MSRSARKEPTPSRNASGGTGAIPYHCVCGETVELDVQSGGRCLKCGRRYSGEVARLAATETIRMPVLSEEPIEPEAETEPVVDPVVEPAAGPRPQRGVDGTGTTAVVLDAPPQRPSAGLPSNRRLGHFRVVGRLGRGGMGDVYRALDESLERYVALKVLRPGPDGTVAGDAGLPRLLEEARAQARVNHPGVVHIYYVSPDPERPFLAMELVPGTTLAERLNDGPLPYQETIDIALQIIRALRHAAKYDVIHGDIKPGNILLAGDGGAKLSDFGLARRLSNRREGPAGPITGTPHYLPPEVLAGAETDVRSDMYALGVMLFEMTFGRRPYTIESGKLSDAIKAHRSAAPEFPDPWPLRLPDGWRNVLSRLLEKAPADRYQSHDELIADLERLAPVELPKAGRFNRLVAWLVDLFLVSAVRGIFLTPFVIPSGRESLVDYPILRLVLPTLSCIAPLAAAWIQAWWRSSPGKALFQLRIVDRHGLTPSCTIFAGRAMLQLLPVWGMAIGSIFVIGLQAEILGGLIGGVAFAATTIDAAVAAIRPDGRSLHDLLLRTRVVLDTRTEQEP